MRPSNREKKVVPTSPMRHGPVTFELAACRLLTASPYVTACYSFHSDLELLDTISLVAQNAMELPQDNPRQKVQKQRKSAHVYCYFRENWPRRFVKFGKTPTISASKEAC